MELWTQNRHNRHPKPGFSERFHVSLLCFKLDYGRYYWYMNTSMLLLDVGDRAATPNNSLQHNDSAINTVAPSGLECFSPMLNRLCRILVP